MKIQKIENKIVVLNEKNTKVLEIESNEHTNRFVENWYFLSEFVDKEPFLGAFAINYK